MRQILLLCYLAILLCPQVASAEPVLTLALGSKSNGQSRIVLDSPVPSPCSDLGTSSELAGNVGVPYYVYVWLDGLDASFRPTGVVFALEYDADALEVLAWYSAGVSEFKLGSSGQDSWPSPGPGVLITLDPKTSHANTLLDGSWSILIGALEVVATQQADLEIVEPFRSQDHVWLSTIRISDESGAEYSLDYPDDVAKIGFGSGLGRNPCVTSSGETPKSTETSLSVVNFGRPNPASTLVEWNIATVIDRDLRFMIVAPTGKLVREWEQQVPAGTALVTWDTLDERGGRVAAGRYFLLIEGGDGYRAVRRTTIIP